MAAKRKKVLAFLPGGGTNEIRVLSGVQDIARTRRFDLSVVECLKRKDGGLSFIRSPGGGAGSRGRQTAAAGGAGGGGDSRKAGTDGLGGGGGGGAKGGSGVVIIRYRYEPGFVIVVK